MKLGLYAFLAASAFLGAAPASCDDFSLNLGKAAAIEVPAQSVPQEAETDAQPEPVICGEADLALFFKRLESVGLDTKEIRDVTSKIEVYFKAPDSVAEAEWGFIRDRLYIPDTFKEDGSNRVRFDLAPHNLNTLIHEYTHAALDVSASEKSPAGSPARIHYNSVKHIWADLFNDPDGSTRYAGMKADEVSGYFMGAAFSTYFYAIDDIIQYNKYHSGGKAASVEEAERLGGKLLLPDPKTATDAWEKGFWKRFGTLGQNRVYDSARFKSTLITGSNLIHWNEEGRDWLKATMFNNILGLHPAADTRALCDKLNSLDNAWIRGVRKEVAKERLKSAKEAEAGK